MVIKHKLSFDLQHAGSVQRIDVVQGDFNSRVLEISLYVDGAPLELPGDTSAALRYRKSDGAVGIYDTLPDGAPAAAIDGNVVTITLAPAMLAAAGSVFAQLRLAQGGKVVATFAFVVNVLADPSCGTTAVEDYMRLSIEEQAKNAVETANSVRQDADAGKFNGNKIFDVTGAPATDLGMVGDWAIDTNTADFYCKESPTTWKKKGNLRGPVGGSMPVDDGKASRENLWTSEKVETEIRKARKEAIDSCTPPFNQSGPIVQGHLVPRYPMQIISHITPWQEGTGEPSPDNVRPIKGWTELRLNKCGKNILNNVAVSKTIQGITFTVNSDKSIIVNGTANGNVYFTLENNISLKEGQYYLSGCPAGGDVDKGYSLFLAGRIWAADAGKGKAITVSKQIKPSDGARFEIKIISGVKCDNLVFKPMFTVGSTSTEYEPYSGEIYTQTLSEEFFIIEFDWKSGKATKYGKLFQLRVADMNNDENYPGWKNSGIFDVIGERKTFTVDNGLVNVGSKYSYNTLDGNDVLFLRVNDYKLTQSQWKAQYPDLVIQVLVPYRQDLRPAIQLQPVPNILSKDGVTIVFGNSGDTTVIARSDPNHIINTMQSDIAALQDLILKL